VVGVVPADAGDGGAWMLPFIPSSPPAATVLKAPRAAARLAAPRALLTIAPAPGSARESPSVHPMLVGSWATQLGGTFSPNPKPKPSVPAPCGTMQKAAGGQWSHGQGGKVFPAFPNKAPFPPPMQAAVLGCLWLAGAEPLPRGRRGGHLL